MAAKDYLGMNREKNSNIIVVHDDITQPIGKFQIHQGPTASDYNGITGIQRSLQSKDFIRISIGVGNGKSFNGKDDIRHFVLEHFDFMDLAVLKDQVFPQIIENHIKQLNFRPVPERQLFIAGP